MRSAGDGAAAVGTGEQPARKRNLRLARAAVTTVQNVLAALEHGAFDQRLVPAG